MKSGLDQKKSYTNALLADKHIKAALEFADRKLPSHIDLYCGLRFFENKSEENDFRYLHGILGYLGCDGIHLRDYPGDLKSMADVFRVLNTLKYDASSRSASIFHRAALVNNDNRKFAKGLEILVNHENVSLSDKEVLDLCEKLTEKPAHAHASTVATAMLILAKAKPTSLLNHSNINLLLGHAENAIQYAQVLASYPSLENAPYLEKLKTFKDDIHTLAQGFKILQESNIVNSLFTDAFFKHPDLAFAIAPAFVILSKEPKLVADSKWIQLILDCSDNRELVAEGFCILAKCGDLLSINLIVTILTKHRIIAAKLATAISLLHKHDITLDILSRIERCNTDELERLIKILNVLPADEANKLSESEILTLFSANHKNTLLSDSIELIVIKDPTFLTKQNFRNLIKDKEYSATIYTSLYVLKDSESGWTKENVSAILQCPTIAYHLAGALTSSAYVITPPMREALITNPQCFAELTDGFLQLDCAKINTPENLKAIIDHPIHASKIAKALTVISVIWIRDMPSRVAKVLSEWPEHAEDISKLADYYRRTISDEKKLKQCIDKLLDNATDAPRMHIEAEALFESKKLNYESILGLSTRKEPPPRSLWQSVTHTGNRESNREDGQDSSRFSRIRRSFFN